MNMNGRNRMLLNITLGITLAVAMTVGLSALTPFSETQTSIQSGAPPEESAPKLEAEGGERPLAADAAPQEERAFSSLRAESGLEVLTTIDPVSVGTPFTVALIAGLATFMIVRRRVD